MVDRAVVWRAHFAFKEETEHGDPPKSAGFAAPYRLGGKGYAGSMWPTRLVTPELRDSCRPMARRQPGRSTLRTQVAAARIGGRNRCLDRDSLLGDEGNVDANGNSNGYAGSIGHMNWSWKVVPANQGQPGPVRPLGVVPRHPIVEVRGAV